MDLEDIWGISAIALAVIVVGWNFFAQWRRCRRDIREWKAAWKVCEVCSEFFDPKASGWERFCGEGCAHTQKLMDDLEIYFKKAA